MTLCQVAPWSVEVNIAESCSAELGSFFTMALAKPVGPTIQSWPDGSERMLGSETSSVLSTSVALNLNCGENLAEAMPLSVVAAVVDGCGEEPKQPASSRSAAAAGRRVRMGAPTGRGP